MLHIHFGPSPLALALVLPICRAAGFQTYLIGRPDKREGKSYVVLWSDGGRYDGKVRWADSPGSLDEVDSDVIGLLRRPESPVLITATLRDAIEARRPLLDEILSLRGTTGGSVTVIPCENDVPALWEEIRDSHPHARFIDAVVDRIALPATEAGSSMRTVKAHPLGEWILKADTSCPAVNKLAQRPEVEVVDDLDPYKQRKLWMVNGGHTALAADARLHGAKSLRSHASNPPNAYFLGHLHRGMNEALFRKYASRTPSGGYYYGADRLAAYTEIDDEVERIVKKLRRTELTPYFQDLEERVFEAARTLASAVQDSAWATDALEPFEVVLDVLDVLIEDLAKAADANELPGGCLSEGADESALDVYRRLVEGWLPEPAARERIDRMSDLLARQRLALARLN